MTWVGSDPMKEAVLLHQRFVHLLIQNQTEIGNTATGERIRDPVNCVQESQNSERCTENGVQWVCV